MRKKLLKTIYVFFLYILFIVFLTEEASAIENSAAINGILDLTNYDWNDKGIVSLEGKWEFYCNTI